MYYVRVVISGTKCVMNSTGAEHSEAKQENAPEGAQYRQYLLCQHHSEGTLEYPDCMAMAS